MIWHNRGFGFHGFSPEAGTQWSVSPTHSHAFTLNVSLDDGTTRDFGRRERPELRFDASGAPSILYTAVQAADTTCFSLAQGVDNSAAA